MSARNLATSLPRRRRSDPMAAFDALPEAPRRWLAAACLPWSAASVRRLWTEALRRSGGDPEAALARLSHIEARRLARDTALVWGEGHPAAEARG